MRILQLIYETPESPFGFGGAGVRAYEIYRRLSDRHDITLISMKYPGACNGIINGLKHVFVGTESKSLIRSVLSYIRQAAACVRKNGDSFDVIVENFLPSTPIFSKYRTKTPVILQVQGIMERHAFRKFNPFISFPMSIFDRLYPKLYDRFIFVSDVTKQKVLADIGRDISFCPVIPNGIDGALLNTKGEDDHYILFLSRIDIYTKGLDLLVRAFEKIAPKFSDISLTLAGYQFDRFDSLVSGLSPALKSRINYAGFATGEEKVRLLSKAKFFVLPSRHESFPISILEAAACGKAVVVSDIPELRFVEENGFGTSFRSGSVDELAEKLTLLMNDRSLRQGMGTAGRAFAKNYLWDSIALRFEDALESAAS